MHNDELIKHVIPANYSLVFFTPPYSGFTSIAMFLFTREVWNTRAGLFAAGFIAIVPGYISRSVAGSYDNEGIAIFALMFTYYLWIKSLKTGSVFWATATALSYFYMVHYTVLWFIGYLLFRSLGICLGWICFHHQFDSSSCLCVVVNGTLFQ